jgi:hypothetical protein
LNYVALKAAAKLELLFNKAGSAKYTFNDLQIAQIFFSPVFLTKIRRHKNVSSLGVNELKKKKKCNAAKKERFLSIFNASQHLTPPGPNL